MSDPRKSKPKPFKTSRAALENEMVVSMGRLLSDHAVRMSALVREHGLTLVHHNVLRILRGAGGDGLPSGTVAERMITKEPDITRLLDRMEKQKLIVRSRDQADRRVVMTRITDHGLKILSKLDGPLEALLHAQFGHVPTEKIEALLAMVQDIRDRPVQDG